MWSLTFPQYKDTTIGGWHLHGGYSDAGSGHFLGFKILNFIICFCFSEFFFILGGGGGGGYEDFVDIYIYIYIFFFLGGGGGVITKLGYI